MNTYIIFDNGGITVDRFTIINSETGDVFAAGETSFSPEQIIKKVGNCSAHRILLNGSGWRQRMPSKKIIETDTENYINNARLDPDWLGQEIDFNTLPGKIREYISHPESEAARESHSETNIVFLSRNEQKQTTHVQ